MRVAYYKQELTKDEKKLKKYLDALSTSEYFEWVKEEIKKYHIGEAIRFTIDGFFVYGVVSNISTGCMSCTVLAGEFKRVGVFSVTPGPRTRHISQEELEAAKRGDFIQ